MSQLNEMKPGDIATGKTPDSKGIIGERKRNWSTFIVASVVVILILIIVGVSFYVSRAPFRRNIITVDDTSITMDYFLKRASLAGIGSMPLISQIIDEQIVEIEAPKYVAEITPEDIEEALRELATGEGLPPTDAEFKEWYRQLLNETSFSRVEYEETIAKGLLAARLQEYLAERVPTVAEHRHIHVIITETLEQAEAARERWEAGEDFTDLARELSHDDDEYKEKGGDYGWLPQVAFPSSFGSVAFNINVNDVSEPQALITDQEAIEVVYYIIMVSEIDANREFDETHLKITQNNALEAWLLEERNFHDLGIHGLNNGFDSETNAWINWQLEKMNN